MSRLKVKYVTVVLVGAIALATWLAWPTDSSGQAQAAMADRVRDLERKVEMLQRRQRQTDATMGQLMGLMEKLNQAVNNPDVRKQLRELREAHQPGALGKARKLSDLSDAEKAELVELDGVIKISSNPIEDRGRLVSRLWDLGVYESAIKQIDKLLEDETKAKGDRWHGILADRINREIGRFQDPRYGEAMLRAIVDDPLLRQDEKGMAWLNNCGSACRKLYDRDAVKYKVYLPRALKLYEASLKINPRQLEIAESVRVMRRAVNSREKP